jgi:hypothetical protein
MNDHREGTAATRCPRYSGASAWPAALVALVIGVVAATFYAAEGLTLSHYDAKGHLVVARRIFDSLHPGWMQMGAVWLPLPHLLNMGPVQFDAMYRTGWSAVALSLAGFVLAAASLWWLIARATGSRLAAWAGFAVLVGQPDVLYLQSTPMTEALLMGLCMLAIALMWNWVTNRAQTPALPVGLTFALSCLTRYEAWPVTAAAAVFAAVELRRDGLSGRHVAHRLAALLVLPLGAILAFMILSRATVGSWLVTGGFYGVEPALYRRPLAGVGAILYGLASLNGYATLSIAAIALIAVLRAAGRRLPSKLLVTLALGACAALPAFAFWSGHPFRIRYMVPLTMTVATVIGLGVGLLPRRRWLAATAVIFLSIVETPPLSVRSPMVLEAQWDRPRTLARQHVTTCLRDHYDGSLILASMTSLAHYMQETAGAGFSLKQYIHEGLGDLWAESLRSPGRHAGWILIAEGSVVRDHLARRQQSVPGFLDGFQRVCEGGGVTLYRRLEGNAP